MRQVGNKISRVISLLTLLSVLACTTLPQSGPEGTQTGSDKPVVLALATDSQRAREQGRYEQAALYLERALRIEPGDPWLWHHLAIVRLEQGRFQQAVHLASKSNALAQPDDTLRQRNWGVIADALEALGETGKAAEARRKAGP